MSANTAQQEKERRERWADKFVALAIRGVLPLIEGGKRDGEAILKLLQVIKDGRHEYDQLFAFINAWKQPAINLAEFFKTREGLCVSPEFLEYILAPALSMQVVTPATVGKLYDLSEVMDDSGIWGHLGTNYIFENPYTFLVTLADLITVQWGGTEGDLLNNGDANLFYVRGLSSDVFAVLVGWIADRGVWYVNAYRFGVVGMWSGGRRAFPCGE